MGIEIRDARDEREVDDAYELASKIFGPSYFESKAFFGCTRMLEPLRSLKDAIVGVKGGEVVGFARILDREFYSPAGILRASGVMNVCVHPELLGQRWGKGIMEAALRRSQERGDAFSILFARRVLDGWYPKFGYVGIGCHPEMGIEKPAVSDLFLPPFTGSIQSGIVGSYLDIYAQAYHDSYQELLLSFYRHKSWWRDLDKRLLRKVDSKDFINVMVGGKPVGYFILLGGRVIEAASLRQHRADFAAGLLQFCVTSHTEQLKLSLPSRHWCVELFRAMNHTLRVRYAWDGGHMVRMLDKGIFKQMVLCSADSDRCQVVERLFQQYDVSNHGDARELLLTIAGASSLAQGLQRSDSPALPGSSLLPMLPTWSVVDEL